MCELKTNLIVNVTQSGALFLDAMMPEIKNQISARQMARANEIIIIGRAHAKGLCVDTNGMGEGNK